MMHKGQQRERLITEANTEHPMLRWAKKEDNKILCKKTDKAKFHSDLLTWVPLAEAGIRNFPKTEMSETNDH